MTSLYKIEKRNICKSRAREEAKPVLQIYGEECSSALPILETAGQFSPHKKVKATMYRSKHSPTVSKQHASSWKFQHTAVLWELVDHFAWCMERTFKPADVHHSNI
ncbi:hypothetical protein T4D_10058 [Trichinella pseudospiralis]|uniref:Uncharacterized protein n=2 Tax=Trichinella pseudospiralis TaxID=6337 RepID=A0A0V1FSC0_TRIPS|nr:hypothetical protein T4D_10058 [Trichinella pseudospiralis]